MTTMDERCTVCDSRTYGQHHMCPVCNRLVCVASRCTAYIGTESVCTDCYRKWSRQMVHALRTQHVATSGESFRLGGT